MGATSQSEGLGSNSVLGESDAWVLRASRELGLDSDEVSDVGSIVGRRPSWRSRGVSSSRQGMVMAERRGFAHRWGELVIVFSLAVLFSYLWLPLV